MTYRTRIKYTSAQKTEIWDRWQRGESLKAIGRVFDRPSSSIYGQLARYFEIISITESGAAPSNMG